MDSQPVLSYQEMTEDYPRFPDILDLDQSQIHPHTLIDVTPYMNPCPYTVNVDTKVPQVFNLFRSMGLRHLPVINNDGQLKGIITRHNLTHEYLETVYERLRSQTNGAS